MSLRDDLRRALTWGTLAPARHHASEVRILEEHTPARDGIRLATDIYAPPLERGPVIIMRTPYGKSSDRLTGVFLAMARRGYFVVAQDCRGTGASEPDS